MRDDADLDWELLASYLAGEGSLGDDAGITEWVGGDPERRAFLDDLRGVLGRRSGGQFTLPPAAEIQAAVLERVTAPSPHHSRLPSARPIRLSSAIGGAVLAGALFLGVGYAWSVKHRIHTAPRIFATTSGQRSVVTLADGVHFTLAPSTTIAVLDHSVRLSGEVYVVAPHHTATPLVIHTKNIATRVLGTAFDVRRYDTDSSTRVIVDEGRVAVGDHRIATVSSGELAHVDDSTITVTPVLDDARAELLWTKGELAFRRTPARELLETVGRWYGLQFRLADSVVAAKTVTARFSGQSTAGVLTALQTLLDVKMRVDGNVVTVTSSASSSRSAPARRDATDFSTQIHEVGR